MRPARESIRSSGHTCFVTSQTVERKPFFRYARWSELMQEVLQHYRGDSYLLHAYVIMPDHFHILISPNDSLERAVQKIKGGFSFRAKKAFEWKQEIWQAGFSDHRIRDIEDWNRHIEYVRRNPVKAKLCERPVDYLYLAVDLDSIPQRLKPPVLGVLNGGAKAPPLRNPQGLNSLYPSGAGGTARTAPFPGAEANGVAESPPFQNREISASLQD